ncbi:hypothetical protein E4U09_004801 [Claviceps aff. purpurea]|uniref:HNH nuclease domain-containing protein n=1 Tax=Claviceps aff. purpurea TaxID=1967640 RepID=A0A9P7U135_9HYPO|nr:hypothetical protein E4U09_004801 [Claviceps aff. purpurea]
MATETRKEETTCRLSLRLFVLKAQGKKFSLVRIVAVTGDCEVDDSTQQETISSAKKQNFRLPAANRYDYGFAQGQPTRTGYPSKKTGHHKTGVTGLLEKEHLYETARHASQQLKDAFKALQSKVEPYIAPDQELPEVDPEASLRLASLGIELALQEKETIRLERELVALKRDAGSLSPHAANKRLRDTVQRYYSAGDDLWRHQKKKMRLAAPGPEEVPILDLRRHGVSDCILALYRKSDGVDESRERPKNWRRDALHYYNANGADHGEGSNVWCHVSGRWFFKEFIKAAHIVPYFLDFEGVGNALIMSKRIENWFDNYHLVIVPVDVTENPITRWRTDVISPSVMNERYGAGDFRARELDGRELTFHNEKRPTSRFLYFHFFMALVRIRDTKRIGWQDTWARSHELRMTEHGFDAPLQLTDDEVVETARRVHLAVEDRAIRAEYGNGSDDESDDGSDDESDDGSDDGSDNNDSSEEEDSVSVRVNGHKDSGKAGHHEYVIL